MPEQSIQVAFPQPTRRHIEPRHVETRARAHAHRSSKTLLFVWLVFVASEVFGGLLRYLLAEAGLAWASYLPKFALSAAVFISLLNAFVRLRVGRALASVLLAILASALVGTVFVDELSQVGFGAFALLPFVGGVLVSRDIDQTIQRRITSYATLLWLCTAIGVTYNFFYEVPWQGFTYQLGDTEVVASREWTTFGIQRIAGFSRASFDAASQLVLFSIPILVFGRNSLVKVCLWVVTGILTAITTTKNELGAVLLIGGTYPLVATRLLSTLSRRAVVRLIPWLVTAVCVALPLSTIAYEYSKEIDTSHILYSFEDRLGNTWPDAFSLIQEHGSWFLGRGVGGIGTGQSIFERSLYNPGDNLFVYLYVSFGAVALVFLFLLASGLAKLRAHAAPNDRLWWLAGNSVLISGWAINAIEEPVQALVLGMVFGHVFTLFFANAREPSSHRRRST